MRRRRVFASFKAPIAAGAGRGLYKAATAIISASQPLVPYETGVLRASARVGEPEMVGDTLTVRAGYGYGEARNPISGEPASGYSVYVHEIVENHHTPPTQSKFLEQPALEYAPELGATVAVEIRKAIDAAAKAL
jgi:hypothetical protein